MSERERALQDTLVTTQRLPVEATPAARRGARAEREAELIVREAELRGDKAVEAARGEEAQAPRGDPGAAGACGGSSSEDLAATLERYQRLLRPSDEAEDDAEGDRD